MAIKVKNLVKILQKKDQEADVEFIVVTTDGRLVCMDVEGKAREIAKAMEVFKSA